MKLFLLGGLLILFALSPQATQAATPDELSNYLAGEPGLICIAHDFGAPVEKVTLAKMRFDQKYGFAHNLTGEQWTASYWQRMDAFAGMLNTPNPLKPDSTGLTQPCARIVEGLKLLTEWGGDEPASP